MRSVRIRLSTSMLPLLLVACGHAARDTAAVNDSLKVGASAATEPALELATAAKAFQPVRFVSELEQTGTSQSVSRQRTLAPSPKARVGHEEQDKPAADSIAASADPPPAQISASVTELGTPSVPRVPMVLPRAAPLPTENPVSDAGNARGGASAGVGPGPDIGTVIGVIIRGGRIDPGHCPPVRRRPPGGILPNR